MARSNTQLDPYAGDAVTRGKIPQNAHFQNEEERIAELRAKANALPADSTARAILVETLRRDYGVEPWHV